MPALGSLNDIYRVRASAKDIVKRALRLIGVLASGDPLTAHELTDAVEAMNDMLDSWNTESLVIWALTRNEFTLTAATNPHEIGPGVAAPGLDAPRPNDIKQGQAWILRDGSEYELRVWTHEEFARWRHTTQTAEPCSLYYEPAMPTGKIWFDYSPDAAYTLVLYLEQMLQQTFSDTADTEISLPPGYKEAITHNLAVKLAPEYGKSAPQELIASAVGGKAQIKRMNIKPLYLQLDPALTGQGRFDIMSGDYR